VTPYRAHSGVILPVEYIMVSSEGRRGATLAKGCFYGDRCQAIIGNAATTGEAHTGQERSELMHCRLRKWQSLGAPRVQGFGGVWCNRDYRE